MKKTLIALAVFGTFTGAALADGNSVTLYGKVDLGVTHFTGLAPAGGVNGTKTVSSTGMSSGITGGDRIGVKGNEDLGGGLQFIFDAETGFCGVGNNQGNVGQVNPSTGATVGSQSFCTGSGYFMGRQAYGGLVGDFGTVLGGRLYDAAFNADATLDPFGAGYTGQTANIDAVVGVFGLVRANQVLAYVTPNMGGFTGTAAYSFAAGSGTVPTASGLNSNVPRAWVLDGQYSAGPIYAVLDYTEATNVVAETNGIPNAKGVTTGINDGKLKVWVAGASYNFGVAKVVAEYQQGKQDYYSGNDKYWMLGATVPVGAGSIMASYGENKNDMVANGSTGAGAGTAKQIAIGYSYSLSKRTSLYTSYAHISNDAPSATLTGTSFTVGDATDSFYGVPGQSASGFALGIVHNF